MRKGKGIGVPRTVDRKRGAVNGLATNARLNPLNRTRVIILGQKENLRRGSGQLETPEVSRTQNTARHINVPIGIHTSPTPEILVGGTAPGALRPLEDAAGIVFGHEDVRSDRKSTRLNSSHLG